MISSALPYIDRVANANPFTGGCQPESDENLRLRFRNFINSRSRATTLAINYAIDCVRVGLRYVIDENVDTSGNHRPGMFVVTVDDGTGVLSIELQADVSGAIERVRPIGSLFIVRAPNVVQADVSVSLILRPNSRPMDIHNAVIAAVIAFSGELQIGGRLSSTRLAEAVYQNAQDIGVITGILINSVPQDLVAERHDLIQIRTVSVNQNGI